MAAHVLEGAQRAVVTANNEDRVRPATVFEVIPGFGDMVDGAGELPYLGPHPLDFELRERRGVVTLRGHQSRALRRRTDRVFAPQIRRGVGHVRRSSPPQAGGAPTSLRSASSPAWVVIEVLPKPL